MHASSNTHSGAMHRLRYAEGPRVLADVGGTNARFALEHAPDLIDTILTLNCADYAQFSDAFAAYLQQACGGFAIRHAAVAIANPVQDDQIQMTNHHWSFSIEATRCLLGLETLLVVNDFTALAMALPHLGAPHCERIGYGKARVGAAIGLVGAGTGLGVGGMIPADGRWIALNSEGGHASFSPNDARENQVLQYAWNKYPHVSAERLVSGPGIELIHAALAGEGAQADAGLPPLRAADIVERALIHKVPLCVEVIDCFCAMLGSVASNVALTLGAHGGMYIGGGVVPRLGSYFARSPFRERFESKGRFSDYLSQIPTFVITAPYPAFIGVAALLEQHLTQCAADKLRLHGRLPVANAAESQVANPAWS